MRRADLPGKNPGQSLTVFWHHHGPDRPDQVFMEWFIRLTANNNKHQKNYYAF